MTDFTTLIVPALLVLGIGTFAALLLAPLWLDLRWRRDRRGRGGRYIR